MSAPPRPECWHLTFADDGRNPLAFTEEGRRAIVRTLARVAGDCLALFSVADDHLHVVPLCSRQRAGRLAQALTLALARHSPGLRARGPRPVENRQHMAALVPYLLKQVCKHQVAGAHPALWSGSCFQDLVGARCLDGLALKLGVALPRFDLGEACRAVGLPAEELVWPTRAELRVLGVARIVDAASAALNVAPGLEGNEASAIRARRTATQLAALAGIALPEIAWGQGVTVRAARRLASRIADRAAQRATLRRLALERAVAAA